MKIEYLTNKSNITDKNERINQIQKLSIYKVDDELTEKGYEYDESRVFIPYKYKNPNNPDCREIYLSISRHSTAECKISYCWCKKVDGIFYTIEEFQRDKLPLEESNNFNKSLSHYGIKSKLDSTKGSYKNFAEQIKKDLSQTNCLEVLKNNNFQLINDHYFGDDEITPIKRDLTFLNRCDMRDLIKIVFDVKPAKEYKRKFLPDYDLINCVLHNDKNPSASVYKHVYICKGCNPPVKLDQQTLIKKAFNITTPSEVVEILNEVGFVKKLADINKSIK